MNMLLRTETNYSKLAEIFQVLGQPSRLQILFGIGHDEVCVCHLEAMLGERQAYISQELMILKDANLVDFRRSGKNIFYHLVDSELLNQVRAFAQQMNQEIPEYETGPIPGCACPRCKPGTIECMSEIVNKVTKER
jgi:ArsR family transcriptional regulator